MHINAFAEAEPEKLRHLWNSLVQPQSKYEMCIFLEKKKKYPVKLPVIILNCGPDIFFLSFHLVLFLIYNITTEMILK